MAETEIYSYSDIRRYLQHQMSEVEMHRFELALMSDPFLADALEGYAKGNVETTEQHLSQIEGAVTGGKQAAKVVALPSQTRRWWKIAAIFIVILMTGVITYSILKKQDQGGEKTDLAATVQSPAKTQPVVPEPEKPLAKGTSQPSIMASRSVPHLSTRSNRQYKRVEIDPQTNPERPQVAVTSTMGYKQQAGADSTKIGDRELAYDVSKVAAGERQNGEARSLTARISPQPSKASTVATMMMKRTMNETPADTGKKWIGSADTNAGQSTGQPAVGEVKSKKNQPDDSLSLAELVIKTMAKRRNRGVTIHTDSAVAAVPASGWVNFQEYIIRQIDSVRTANPLLFDEDIQVEFSLDSNGRPTNISLPGTVNPVVREKIVQSLTDGPQWQVRRKDKKVTVIMEF